MQITKASPTCPDCIAHDAETKRLVQALLHDDETRILSLILGRTLQTGMDTIKGLPKDDIRRLTMQRDLDWVGCTMGKLMVSLDDVRLQALRKAFKKMGVTVEVQHESCPGHLSKTTAPAPNHDEGHL